jgi:transporter family-2 protein
LLLGTARGLRAPAYGLAGLNAVLVLLLIAFAVPRIGIALFFSAATLGSVASALMLDHFGTFGAARRRITWHRALGVAIVAAGVIAVRVAA